MSVYYRFVLLLAVLVLCCFGFLSEIRAQQGNTIEYGQIVTGSIAQENFRIVYAFQGRAGDVVDATLKTTNGTLDPVLLFSDDQNNLLARDDDGAAGFDAS